MPQHWLPYIPAAALVISVIALVVSGANLGWNIYKEVGLRARLRIRFALNGIHHPSFSEPLTRFVFSVTNHGPGKVKLMMLQLREAPVWRRLLFCPKYFALMYDHEHPLGGKLPYVLDVGEGMDFSFPVDAQFVSAPFTHIGITDSFGRVRWCSRREVREAMSDLQRANAGPTKHKD